MMEQKPLPSRHEEIVERAREDYIQRLQEGTRRVIERMEQSERLIHDARSFAPNAKPQY